jgi:hypothetical protein
MCNDFDEKETVYTKRIETFFTLLRNTSYHTFVIDQMRGFLSLNTIDPEYRFKTVLSLKTNYDMRKRWVSKEERGKLDEEQLCLEKIFLLFLLKKESYDTMFRILCAQYLLVRHKDMPEEAEIMEILLSIGETDTFYYNLRADATDVVLRYGKNEHKSRAGELIARLGKEGKEGEILNIYDNAQNAHTQEIEESALKTLRALSELPIHRKENGDTIDFDYVETRISPNLGEKGKIALNRIKLDCALYGPHKLTLKSCLVYVYSYICTHTHRELLLSRLYEELRESSGICSTGIMERMANTFSGIVEDYSIRISFEDEILAALHGRLNKKIAELTNQPCIHATDKKFCSCLDFVCEYGKALVSGEIKIGQQTDIPCGICTVCVQREHLLCVLETRFVTMNDLKCVHACKEENCNENFVGQLLEEMIIPTRFHDKRRNFLRFFRRVFPDLLDELQKEYESYIDSTSFDIYTKKAIIKYEGET